MECDRAGYGDPHFPRYEAGVAGSAGHSALKSWQTEKSVI